MKFGRKCLRWSVLAALWSILVLVTAWAMAALYFDMQPAWLRVPLAVIYLAVVVVLFIKIKWRWLAACLSVGAFLLVLVWWLTLKPSNDRDWQPDVAMLSYAEIESNRITIHNIRNCDYRSETDYDVHYYDRIFDLADLRTVDLYLVYWGSPHMAHTMVSFGFAGGDYVCMSIETRKEKGEGYSAIKGFFRQFELIYIIGDERDLVRLRTNFRQGEEAYLYRLRASPEQARELLLDYLRRANELKDRPEWYNALTDNCTTAIRAQRAATERIPWDWRILVNGHLDELLYARGAIATNLPFAEVKQACHINARAVDADGAATFPLLIRKGVPGIEP